MKAIKRVTRRTRGRKDSKVPIEQRIREGTYKKNIHGSIPAHLIIPKPKFKLPSAHIDDTTKRWIKNASDELAVKKGCRFDERYPEYVCECWQRYLKHSKGRWAGKPFIPIDWQRNDLVYPMYGWIRPDGFRRFRNVYCEIPKKNGKSTIGAAIGITALAFDGEMGAEVYSCAADKDQSSIVHGEAVNMIEASMVLNAQSKINRTTRAITWPETKSVYRALSSSIAGKEGYNIHCAIIDELHIWPDRRVWDALEYGFATREQPLRFIITTSGEDMQSICREQHDYSIGVTAGTIEDQNHLGVIYNCKDEDWEKEEAWKQANPSMGETLKLEEFQNIYKGLQSKPSEVPNFKRRRLNIWCTSTKVWIDQNDWKANSREVSDEQLAGGFCNIGIDLAKTKDTTALVLMFPNYDGNNNYFLKPFIFLPEDRVWDIKHLIRNIGVWVNDGDLITTEGNVADYDYITDVVCGFIEKHNINVTEIVYDPYNAEQFTQRMMDRLMCERMKFGQSIANYAEPTEEFERSIISKQMHHPNNQVMNWQFSHCHIYTDKGGRQKPERRTRDDVRTIDSCVSAVMAFARRGEIENQYYDGAGVY